MKQTSLLTRNLAAAQERHADIDLTARHMEFLEGKTTLTEAERDELNALREYHFLSPITLDNLPDDEQKYGTEFLKSLQDEPGPTYPPALDGPQAILFSLYTEDKPHLARLVSRYFDGATIYPAEGVWQREREHAAVIQILGTFADLQRIFDLAGDIRVVNDQQSVIVTWQTVSRFDVTAEAINHAAL